MDSPTFVGYQVETDKTALYREKIAKFVDTSSRESITDLLCLCYCALGLVGEAGEVANKVKKVLRDDSGKLSPEKKIEISAEVGDTLWYNAQMVKCMNILQEMPDKDTTLGDIANANVAKLLNRKLEQTLQGSGDNR